MQIENNINLGRFLLHWEVKHQKKDEKETKGKTDGE